MKIVYIPGVFDCLHHGHLSIIKRAKELGDILVAGVVSDAGCMKYKGKLPLFDIHHRLDQVQALKWVDLAIIQRETDPTRELEVVQPDILVHGDEWDRLKEGHETLERLGIEFKLLPHTKGISSTLIRENL